MPDIAVIVRDKVAQVQGNPEIVCGNSDYTVTFDFDAEWDAYEHKTAHFSFLENGVPRYFDVQFSGNSVQIPAVWNTCEMLIGAYAGDIRTTTGAAVPCIPCITDDEPVHPDPPPDVYEQLVELLEEMQSGGGQAVLCDALICAADPGIAAATNLYPQFSCDTGYYFDSQVTCTIYGRQFTRMNDLPAIGVIIHYYTSRSWTVPLFISPFASAVIYSTSYGSQDVGGSVDYDGIKWYYGQPYYAQPGTYNDSEGHLLTYSGTIVIQSDEVAPESVLEILQSVHAQKED